MNKTLLLGRLTKDPEVRYSQGAQPLAIARYTLAVNRRFKKQGEPDADFIPCVAFGKQGEFAEKYLHKGQQINVVGRLQVRNWEDNEGHKRTTTEVVVDEQYFAESKQKTLNEAIRPDSAGQARTDSDSPEGFYPVDEIEDEDLPF